MKKVVINLILVLSAFVIYYLQSNFFSWFTINGIMPNLFVILVLFIGLFANKTMGVAYGVSIGIIIDLLFSTKVGISAVVLGTIGYLAGVFDKNFSKDSRMTIMVMVMAATVIFEMAVCLLNYMFISNNIEIFNFIFVLVVEVIFNVLLTIIFYPIIHKFGYYMENEFKGNQILTRYF